MAQQRLWRFDYAVDRKGQKPAKIFWDNLSPNDQVKFNALFHSVAYSKQYHNDKRYKKLNTSEGIWQLRAGDYRLLCYHVGNCLILTNGFRKDQKRTDKRCIELAIKIKKENTERGK